MLYIKGPLWKLSKQRHRIGWKLQNNFRNNSKVADDLISSYKGL